MSDGSPQLSALVCVAGTASFTQDRPRARDLGIQPGAGVTGALNAITDVTGVRVGQVTLVDGRTVRTGVTAILPHGGNLFREKVPGAVFVGNAFGKLAGSTQVQELGTIESPIVLTNTLGVGVAVDAVVRWTLTQPGNESVRSVNALVGETNDGGLNDIRSLPVTRDHVTAAITRRARGRSRGRRCRRRHGNSRLWMERRHRHVVAASHAGAERMDRRRARAIELRWSFDHRRRACVARAEAGREREEHRTGTIE